MVIDDLMLLSGHDIPFPSAELSIHPPTIKEISYLSERTFFLGIDMLNFSKDKLSEEDRNSLVNQSDFDIFMSIVGNSVRDSEILERVQSAILILSLLFPDYEIQFQQNGIILSKDKEFKTINSMNYDEFKQIISAIFLLDGSGKDNNTYNPQGAKAKALAEKFKRRREKLNKGRNEKIAVYSRYASILAVALRLPLSEVLNYTVYQINDQIERFGLYENWQQYFSAKVAGATGMDDAENWMKDIHS